MSIDRLRDFVKSTTHIVSDHTHEAEIVSRIEPLMKDLVAHDDWLPDAYAQPHPTYYQQYLLHCDPLDRFSLVSFVWGPGQFTPIHDHTVWGLIGMLRGSEHSLGYKRTDDGRLVVSDKEVLEEGQVCAVSPTIGDIHKVSNAVPDKPSISIHIYGANIGAVARHVYDASTGQVKNFVSGYSNTTVPNLWDLSAQVRATLS